MTMLLYLNALAALPQGPEDAVLRGLPVLRGTDTRRTGRMTQLALAALLPALPQYSRADHLFLAAPSGPAAKMLRALDSLQTHGLPNILDFTAALPNAALFACCRAAGISGSGVFCAVSAGTLVQPLWLAAQTLKRQGGGSAWVGWAAEALPGTGEPDGALWWQVGCTRGADCRALLRLVHLPEGAPEAAPEGAVFWPEALRRLLLPEGLLPAGGGRGWFWQVQAVSEGGRQEYPAHGLV